MEQLKEEVEVVVDNGQEVDENLSVNNEAPKGEENSQEPSLSDEEVIVTIGDETPPQNSEQNQAPEWVRELRKAHRETQRENRELRNRLKELETPAQEIVQVGKKPSLQDFDYDADKFEVALSEWHEKKRKADEAAAQQKVAQQKAEDEWKQKLSSYGESKTKLKVKDFDDAESVVLESFNQTQQGIIIQGSDNSALVIYAIGKNPERAKELASIKDPIKFAFTIAKLEKDLKVTNRKTPPPPETKVDGTGPKSGTVDSTLERLRTEAAKTGDYTKVYQYKQKKRGT